MEEFVIFFEKTIFSDYILILEYRNYEKLAQNPIISSPIWNECMTRNQWKSRWLQLIYWLRLCAPPQSKMTICISFFGVSSYWFWWKYFSNSSIELKATCTKKIQVFSTKNVKLPIYIEAIQCILYSNLLAENYLKH